MRLSEIELLRHFSLTEKDYAGKPVNWNEYHGKTILELDRLRHDIRSPCTLIRGSHGPGKETAVDCVFPHAPFQAVVMSCMRSTFSRGFYEGGSLHFDTRMRADGLLRCWLAFKPERALEIANMGLIGLKISSSDGWDYYQCSHAHSWELLSFLIQINSTA